MSVTKERRLTCYPSLKYNELIRAYAKVNEMTESKAGSIAIKCFIDSLPSDVKNKIINAARQINRSKNSY